jgi:hypothetical protein
MIRGAGREGAAVVVALGPRSFRVRDHFVVSDRSRQGTIVRVCQKGANVSS